jgi:acyl-CoA synthetase (AMP-forming)/AMP-acid ligase II
MHIARILNKAVQLWPDKEAIVCGDLRLSYRQFYNRALRLAKNFQNLNISPGSRIGILHHNCHIFLECYFAAALANLILVPINPKLAKNELEFILVDSGAEVIISNQEPEKELIEIFSGNLPSNKVQTIIWTQKPLMNHIFIKGIQNLFYDDILNKVNYVEDVNLLNSNNSCKNAHLYYTSGTTGKPKGVILTHDNVVTHAIGTIAELQLTESDVWAHIAPLYHLADAWATFAITMVGGKHVLIPDFEPSMVLQTIIDEGMTISNLIPTMLNILVNDPNISNMNFPEIRCMLSGGAPIAPELVKNIIEIFNCQYIQTYGMTESSPYLTMSILKEHLKTLPENERFQYISRTGRPFITVELKVVDGAGNEIKPNDKDVGEIWVKGPTITPGYWNNPEETEAAFCDGWLKTGDLAVIDSEGYVNIVDRKKDMILTGGENVYSTEVEYIIYEHPSILEVAVIGVPNDKWGEAVKAVVVPKEGITIKEAEIIQFCKERLTYYKIPKSVDIVSELPKTGSGKVQKKRLKDRYWAGMDKKVH